MNNDLSKEEWHVWLQRLYKAFLPTRFFLKNFFFIIFSFFSSYTVFSQTTLFFSDFENATSSFAANGWNVVNPGTNKWHVGTAEFYSGNKGAYISNNSGTNNKYKKSLWQNAHFYRDVVIPSSVTGLTLSFTYKGIGEEDWDKLLVYTAPTTVTPTTSYPVMWDEDLPGANLVFKQTDEESSWVTESVALPNSLAGTTVRLIFTWQNDDNGGSNPAAAIDDISLTYCEVPTVTGTTTHTCIGGGSGTITASASGGSAPYTYSLNGSSYQSSATFTGLTAGAYTLYVKSNCGSVGSALINVTGFPNSSDNQNATATDSWIGHLYSGMNFDNYIGHFTEPETFDEGFGGSYDCFSVTSASTSPSLYTERFSARFRMNSTRKGLYIADLGSDDGSRLTVDGDVIYNNWSDQSFTDRYRVLMSLTGSSSLNYEFYENSGANRVIFQSLTKVLSNELTSNTTQSICLGSIGSAISGDAFGTLPSGISLSGTGYQWSYSATPGGAKIDIAGATSATFTPNTSVAPFTVAGTYYIYRNAKLRSANNTGVNPYTASNVSNAAVVTINSVPAISYTTTPTCVGGSTGTITVNGSGAQSPYTYRLNSGSYQSGNLFTGLAADTYNVYVKSSTGCIASTSAIVSPFANSADDQNETGSNSWIGHLYSGMNFDNYIGHFTEPETFDEGFGGSYDCFSVTSASTSPSLYTERFSVRFRMNSTRKGLYIADLGSDDGSRLTVDGTVLYNNWADQAFSNRNEVLMSLTGSSSLNYEFYENSGANRVIFQNLTKILSNELTSNTTQSICLGSVGSAISGDAFGTLPSGISLSGTGYQWSYSATLGGAKIDIAGATLATFTPNTSVAPFTVAGTYYIYRNVKLRSANNTGVNPYVAANVSNAATITVNATPSATISYAGAPFCNTLSAAEPVTISGIAGGNFTATPAGLSINASTGVIIPSASAAGNYAVTYTFTAPGCSVYSTSCNVNVGIPGTWTGKIDNDWSNASNWICGLVPGISTDALLPGNTINYPTVINGVGSVKNITLQNDSFLTVKGTLRIAGNIIDNGGAINAADGSIEMNGSSGQTISGSFFAKKTIKNLIVSNTGSGLSVSSAANDTLKISGTLSFGNSNSILNTGDNITLVSDSTGTANVGIVGAGNAINGKVTVERYINIGTVTGQHAKSWQFLATPTNGQTIKESWMENGSLISTGYGTQVTGAGGAAAGFDKATATPSIKYYNPLTNSWVGVANTTEPIYNPKGYMVFVRGDRGVTTYTQPANTATLRTKGALLTGSLSPISVIPGKMESVGNPYASPIDFTLIAKGAGIDDKFYVWDPYLYGSYGLGGYQTLSSTNNWVPVPGGTVTYKTGISCKAIQSGQAFFVQATPLGGIPSDYTLTFTEACKTGSSSSLNFARHKDISISQKQLFCTSLYTGADSNSIIADGNVVAFGKKFDNGIDRDDAFKMTNSGENFGLKRDGKILSIEAKSTVTDVDTIYFNMSNLRRQTYQLRFTPENMENGGLEAFLIDQFLNTTTPVSLTDKTVADIIITGNTESAAADRFKVVFKRAAPVMVIFASINAYEKGNGIALEWGVKNESDMLKYVVEKSRDGKGFIQSATVPAGNQGTGNYQWMDQQALTGYNYYRIHGISKDGKSIYTQVMKALKGKIGRSIYVYPNPVIDGNINLLLTDQPAGTYNIRLLNPLGQVIISKSILHTGGNRMEKIRSVNQNIHKGVYQLEVSKPDGNVEVIKLIE